MNSHKKPLDVIVPVSLELDWPTKERIVQEIREQHDRFGFTRFALAAPCGGWRSVGYPPTAHFRDRAELFLQVKNALAAEGISCGWWITATVKSGPSPEFQRIIRDDGSPAPFSSCPLDPAFRKRFSEDVALFAEIAKPAFIITEDDFSIMASASRFGCFCPHHLAEFSRREGRTYTRESLVAQLSQNTPEAAALLRRWQMLLRDSLVGLGAAMRTAVDRKSPEIPMGTAQTGNSDADGDITEPLARAMAGPRHTPFSRLYGAFYCGGDTKDIPIQLYHPLYNRQHIPQPFTFYHETDTFPHTRFFTSAAQIRAIMGAVYSWGFDGSLFQTQQLLDMPNEEPVYGAMFAKERPRFEAAAYIAAQCTIKGAQMPFDPFYGNTPQWLHCVSMFGIPHTTQESEIIFLDANQAAYLDDDTIRSDLSRGLFLDGGAAKQLCRRGYGKYLGVEMGDDVASGTLRFDLGAREVICESFTRAGQGKHMPSAHMYACGRNGQHLRITVTDPRCEVISEACTFQKHPVAPAMTRFENELGGRVVVMGMTLNGNRSQSLLNYRRQRLLQDLLVWCGDRLAFAQEAPGVFTIMNEAKNPADSGFLGMLTLINLCEDDLDGLSLHLPPQWRNAAFSILDTNGSWQECACTRTPDGIRLSDEIRYSRPVFLLVR